MVRVLVPCIRQALPRDNPCTGVSEPRAALQRVPKRAASYMWTIILCTPQTRLCGMRQAQEEAREAGVGASRAIYHPPATPTVLSTTNTALRHVR